MINVIGGAGFIGSCLCRQLTDSDQTVFRIIDKKKSVMFPEKSVIADIRSVSDLQRSLDEESTIINLAAEHRDDVLPLSLYDEVNVNGAINLCAVARLKKIRTIIFTSSVAVYGFSDENVNEDGAINPFNDYGRTKAEAEKIYLSWQKEDPKNRTLIIIRPTVVFGEGNRGNVYNLLRQISSGHFLMIGDGKNSKSMAYVENLTAFIRFNFDAKPGLHIYNYADKPDLNMNELVMLVRRSLGKPEKFLIRLPYSLAYCIGKFFDLLRIVTGKSFLISSIRIKKFCSNTVYVSKKIINLNFSPPFSLPDALEKTIHYEFIEIPGNKKGN